eukprot:TRINITY_DN4160_c0_g1_i1.p1 TRINITY_DN4160_c0_g1~~TRINITY_DN4160_c0_g1_i1.p1  ORF type:complete len:627 (+),score=184.66 TRINITY_DN4160_c0_g1_i1:166-1881(+)
MATLTHSPSIGATDPLLGLLIVEVIEASHLARKDLLGKSDPYVQINFGTSQWKTPVLKRNLNPVWNQVVRRKLHRSEAAYNVEFEVYDWDRVSAHDLIGGASVDLSRVLQGEPQALWLNLATPKHPGRDVGKLHVRCFFKPLADVARQFWTGIANPFDYDSSNSISLTEFYAIAEAVASTATDTQLAEFFERGQLDARHELSIPAFVDLMTDVNHPTRNVVLPPDTDDLILSVMEKVEDETRTIESILLEPNFHELIRHPKKPGERDIILVHNRKTGKLEEEKIPDYIKVSMRLMYATGGGRLAVENSRVRNILKHLTEKQGKKFNAPASVKEIPHFVEYHHLDTNEMLNDLSEFKNFNEFFYRKLKPSARPLASPDPNVAVSPADCRMHVFPTIDQATQLWIKGKHFNLHNLIDDAQLEKYFDGGSMVICRLAPQDYHRYHSPVDGVVGDFRPHDGTYYTVNPLAIREHVDVYTENKRCRTFIDSPQFGSVLYISVGATMVGSIGYSVKKDDIVKRGDEFGWFAFGGSTILLFFAKNKIIFDEDLLVNSGKPIETLVAVGNSIGKAVPLS